MNALHGSLYCLEENREPPSPGSPYLDSPGRPPADGHPLFRRVIPRRSRTEGLGARERKLAVALRKCRVIRGREHTCHCYNRHIGDWEQAPCAPRGAGVYQVPPTLQFPHPWGQRATALPSGSGWDVTVIITTVADLRFAPPDAASALSCFPPRGLPCVGGPPGTPLPPHSLIGEPHSRREEAGQGVPSPSLSLQGLR